MGNNDYILKDIKEGNGLKPLKLQKDNDNTFDATKAQDGNKSGIGYLKHSLEEAKRNRR